MTIATYRSRRLGRSLARLREQAGLTQDAAAKLIGCSESRVSRIESGVSGVRPADVLSVLRAYSLPVDDDRARLLIEQARGLREGGWWQKLDVDRPYAIYLSYEADAAMIRNFEPTIIPGLLQIERYARVITGGGEGELAARLKRQEVLTRDETPLRLHIIMSEATLLLEVGSQDVLREQLVHLVELSGLPNVTIQVLRFEAGAHLATTGPFALLTFDDHDDPPLGYVESAAGQLLMDREPEIARLERVWRNLTTLARSPAESAKLIQEMIK